MKLRLFIAALTILFTGSIFADDTPATNASGTTTTNAPAKSAVKKKNKKNKKTAAAASTAAPPAEPAKNEPAPQTAATPAPPAPAGAPKTAPSVVKTDLYTVADGTKVDAKTLDGFKIWRAAACDRCHGANQEGMVGPSLIESLKKLTKAEFVTTLKDGRLEKGMPPWNTNEQVMKGVDNLYAYLKGRSDGAITKAKVSAME